jgi:hypothetical protein
MLCSFSGKLLDKGAIRQEGKAVEDIVNLGSDDDADAIQDLLDNYKD